MESSLYSPVAYPKFQRMLWLYQAKHMGTKPLVAIEWLGMPPLCGIFCSLQDIAYLFLPFVWTEP
jgi:hypothetical protein